MVFQSLELDFTLRNVQVPTKHHLTGILSPDRPWLVLLRIRASVERGVDGVHSTWRTLETHIVIHMLCRLAASMLIS